MLDISYIPTQSDNVKIFYSQGSTTWQTWTKPRNCKYVWIMCIGGGAGGQSGTNEVGNSGGAGGGSGGVCRVIYPSNVLPDILFVQPGAGSAGAIAIVGASPINPSTANRSFVTIAAGSTAAMNTVCVSGAAGAGTTTGPTAETAITTGNYTAHAALMVLGIFVGTVGQAGAASGFALTPLASTITSGGASGGQVTIGGGQQGLNVGSVNLGIYTTPQITGGAGGGAGSGGRGGAGIWNWKPMFGLGGAGGGGTNTGINSGGIGGDGAYGCGGGGGGAGNTLGGNGGRGGDGLVIIASL